VSVGLSEHISELWASLAIYDHTSVTCHLRQVKVPHSNLSRASWYLIYLPRRDERLSWPGWHG